MEQQFDTLNSEFIGRQHEIKLFKRWVNEFEKPSLFFIYDMASEKDKQGGIGKTTLLRRLFALTQEQYPAIIPVMIDFFTIEARNGVFIANKIVEAIRKKYSTWFPANYLRIRKDYYQALQMKHQDILAIRRQMGEALTNDLADLKPLVERDKGYILLFFDTFERVEINPMNAFLSSERHFPDYYHFDLFRTIAAGRHLPEQSQLGWNWSEKDIRPCALTSFTTEEIEQFMSINVPALDFLQHSSQPLKSVKALTEGRPILLALLTEILRKQKITVDQLMREPKPTFEEKLATQIMSFHYPLNYALLFMSHVHHRFNESMLQAIFQEVKVGKPLTRAQYKKTTDELVEFPSVRTSSSSDDFALHDELQRLVKKYCWPTVAGSSELRLQISKITVAHYEGLLRTEEDEEIRESYFVEMLYHKLFIDADDGLDFFYEHFMKALKLSQTVFARNLLEEVKRFHKDAVLPGELPRKRLSAEQLDDLKLAEAELLLEEDAPKSALQLYEELENNTSWMERRADDLFFGKANSYLKAEMYSQATEAYEKCLRLFQISKARTSEIYNGLGLIARRQSNYSLAIEYYETSLGFLKNLNMLQQYASVLNNLGNAYRLNGTPEKGLLYCKRALQIREQLFREGKAGQLPVGLSHSTLGLIYHTMGNLAQEEFHYNQAFQIFQALGSKVYLAGARINLGKIWNAKGNRDEALQYFQDAYRLVKGLNRETEIESLNQQGRVYRDRGQWQNAIDYLTKAVVLSREVKQRFNISENLIYLADCLAHLRKPYAKELEEARNTAPNKYAQGRVEEIQGDIFYREGDFPAAFTCYGLACRLFAQYSEVEFAKMLERLESQLLDVPSNMLSGIITSLLTYWTEEKLNETYPQLPSLCRAVQSL
jgi:tetratricopeptide (TPR) repeat protein